MFYNDQELIIEYPWSIIKLFTGFAANSSYNS